jgi:hypothetical protein
MPDPSQLLKNGNFDFGYDNWSFFEGAHLKPLSEEGINNVAFIPNWTDARYAGFMQNQIEFDPVNGKLFTLTFKAKFEINYSADQTFITLRNGDGSMIISSIDITDQITANLGQWGIYTVNFDASSYDFMNDNTVSVLVLPEYRFLDIEESNIFIYDLNLSQQLV